MGISDKYNFIHMFTFLSPSIPVWAQETLAHFILRILHFQEKLVMLIWPEVNEVYLSGSS